MSALLFHRGGPWLPTPGPQGTQPCPLPSHSSNFSQKCSYPPTFPIPHLTWGVLNPKRKREEGKATGLQVTLRDKCLAQKRPEKCHSLEELCYEGLVGGHRDKTEMVVM